jgi:hypothetical protein
MTTPQLTPFQADFDAKPLDEQVTCLRRWASDPATHARYYDGLRWLFDRDQPTWRGLREPQKHWENDGSRVRKTMPHRV